MTSHSEHCSSAEAYSERVFRQLEDNRPSDVPADFSGPLPETSKTTKPKSTASQTQLARNNTVGSPDVYTQSDVGKSTIQRTGSVGNGRVAQLVASYEARSRRTEDLAQETARRRREMASAENQATSPDDAHSLPQDPKVCHVCIANEDKGWVKVVDEDLD
ncbi:hypothetical protein CDEST_02316 [Colletotrichum destructivum]|uniref:Uncharacterized protein n=1 Tax=Colletotrichum destructivum TaxID=34406 RepID=A0AAX4I1S1_9PEZI|nr:hypothetical protein CDEST_02316 [Colletotrichum destructivum]